MPTLREVNPQVPFSDVDFGDESIGESMDLHASLTGWRAEAPMRIVKLWGDESLLLLSYEAVTSFLRSEDLMPAAPGYIAGSGNSLGAFISTYEGDDHRVRRAIMSPPFRKKVMPKYFQLIRDTAVELVDGFLARGPDAGPVDLVNGFTKRFPLRVISRMLGLPGGRDDMEMAQMALDLIRWDFDREAATRAKDGYVEMVTPLIAERRKHRGDDLISLVIHTEFEGYHLNNDEIHAFVRHLFPAGADTTLLGLGNVLAALLTNPELMAVALNEPERRDAIIEEGMRWDAPVANLPRSSRFDRAVEWHGVTLPPATRVICSIQSANRDEKVFANSDVFDVRRPFTAVPVTFGFGAHFCVGNHLALAEMRGGLDTLLDKTKNLRLVAGANPNVVGSIMRGPAELVVEMEPAASS
jgi:cytochrome P450